MKRGLFAEAQNIVTDIFQAVTPGGDTFTKVTQG
jgi:hypothetical protein